MPVARVMNMPDGSTPIPALGGGDQNGTLATSILGSHAGTGATQMALPRHICFQSKIIAIPGGIAPQASSEPVMLASQGIASPSLNLKAVEP